MRKITHSIFARPINHILVISFFMISLIPVSVLGIKVYNAAWDNAWREIHEKHRLLALNMAEPIRIYMLDKQRMMGILAQSLTGTLVNAKDRIKTENILKNSRPFFKDFSSLSLIYTKEVKHCYTLYFYNNKDNIKCPDNYQNNKTVISAIESKKWALSDVERSQLTSQPIIYIAYPLFIDNILHGVLVGELKLDEIERLRLNIHFGEKGHSAIVDSKGRALAHPNPEWMKEIKDLSHIDIVKKMITGNTGVTTFYSPHIKQDMVAGYTHVKDLGWGIMVPQPKPEVDQQVENILFSQLIWAMLGLLVAMSFAIYIARKITTPINQLAQAAHDIVLNEYENKLPLITNKVPIEIQELNNAIIDLVSGLQDSHSEINQLNASLQERINQATKQLRISNEQLQNHANAAEQANKTKSDFLANMSHELRTPLNAIIGYTDLLIEEIQDSGDATHLTDLNKIKKSSLHLLNLINDVLDISKIESGNIDLNKEDINVSDLVMEIEKTLTPLFHDKNNQLSINFNNKSEIIFTDRMKLYQILLNLISNANKFTENGKIEVTVSNETILSYDWIAFSIKDNGIGISEEQQKTIFNAFNQANHDISKKYGGTGLGLAISQEYAHMMGGDIKVDSKVGSGSNFILFIPLDK